MTDKRTEVEHYNTGSIEVIDFIADKLGVEGFRAYVLGNVIKYAARAPFKGQFNSDVEKIRNYAVILQEHETRNDHKVKVAEGKRNMADAIERRYALRTQKLCPCSQSAPK